MLIENKYVVREVRDNVYFTGLNGSGYPVLESLNSRVRTYKTERAAKMAINRIGAVEYCEFAVEYIKSEEVPDVSEDKPQSSEPPIIADSDGWETLDSFGKIEYRRKKITTGYVFAVLCDDGTMREFGSNEAAAWIWYSDFRRDFGVRRIESRSGKFRNSEGDFRNNDLSDM